MGCSCSKVSDPAGDVAAGSNSAYINAVYYPSWKVDARPPSSLDLRFVSHVFYAFARLSDDGDVYLNEDDERGLRPFSQLREANPHLKVILSIGGALGSEYFAAVAADDEKTSRFLDTCEELVNEYGLNGLDVDWEHPESYDQAEDYVSLLTKLRKRFPAPTYVLTTALPASSWGLRAIVGKKKMSAVARQVDFINLMTYDFFGPWGAESGHHAQLHSVNRGGEGGSTNDISCASSIDYVRRQNVPASKITLGIPAYGRSFPGTNGPHQAPTSGINHREIEYSDLPVENAEEVVDTRFGAAYCVSRNDPWVGFVSYDTPGTVAQKAQYARNSGLAGLFFWHAAGDVADEDAEKGGQQSRSLVRAGFEALN